MGREKIYPYAVARIRMLENSLLTEKIYTQLIEARSTAEVFKILAESGYGAEGILDAKNYEKSLSNRLSKAYADVKELVPDENVGAMTGASKPAGRQDEQKEIFDAMERAGDNLEAAVRKARKEAGLE